MKWYSSQSNEVDADLFALRTIAGKYKLEALSDALLRLSPNKPAENSFAYAKHSHHHPSLRQAILTAKVMEMKRSDQRNQITNDTPIAPGVFKVRRTSRETSSQLQTPQSPTDLLQSELYLNLRRFLFSDEARKDGLFLARLDLEREKVPAEALPILIDSAIRLIQNDNNLGSLPKLVRIFDTLQLLSDGIEYLNASQRKNIRQALALLSLGKNKDWAIESFYDQLIPLKKKANFFGPKTKRSTEFGIREILETPALASTFSDLFKLSPKWRAFQERAYAFHFDGKLASINRCIDEILSQNWPDRFQEAFFERLNTLPLRELLNAESNPLEIDTLLSLTHHRMDFSSIGKPSNNRVLKFKLELREKSVKDIKENKILTVRQFVKDPPLETLDVERLSVLKTALASSISTELLEKELSPEDISKEIPSLIDWYRKLPEDTRDDLHIEFQILPVLGRLANWGFSKKFWTESEARRIYTEFAVHRKNNEPDYYLRSQSPTELKAILSSEAIIPIPEDPLNLPPIWIDELNELIPSFGQRLEIDPALLRLRKNLLLERKKALKFLADLQKIANLEPGNSKLDGSYGFLMKARQALRDPEVAQRFFATLNLTEWSNWLEGYNQALKNIEPHGTRASLEFPIPVVNLLLEELVRRQNSSLPFEAWARTLELIKASSGNEPWPLPYETSQKLSDFAVSGLRQLSHPERKRHLENTQLVEVISTESLSKILGELFLTDHKNEISMPNLRERYAAFKAEIKSRKDSIELSHLLDRYVVQGLNIQPGSLNSFISSDQNELGAADYPGYVRGLSVLVNEVQKLPVKEQLETIHFMMGRSKEIPPCVLRLDKEVQNNISKSIDLIDLIVSARAKLSGESSVVRGLALLPFFSGKGTLLDQENGREIVLDDALKTISPKYKDLARELANGILRGEGKNSSVALAMLFGQPTRGGGALSEGEILRGLFYAYGVPGMKFGQYFAFASLDPYIRELLGEIQDQALPISYLEAVRILESKFPNGLQRGMRVLSIKGSGSVNVAIEIYNPESNINEVLTFSREGIQAGTREDFRRLRNVLIELARTEAGKTRYGFMLGLDRVIEKSVELEFNRLQVFKNQKALHRILNQQVGKWRVRMVEAHEFQNETIRMEKALGTSARVMATSNPQIYREAMLATSEVIVGHLLWEGNTPKENNTHYADSDFHDGQAFISPSDHTVYLIDPGQSIAISKEEFEIAKSMLRLLVGGSSLETGASILTQSPLINPERRKELINHGDLRKILKSKDVAGGLVHLISHLTNQGGDVPLPVVQWILGMNRQRVLQDKLGSTKLQTKLFKKFLGETSKELVRSPMKGCHNLFALAGLGAKAMTQLLPSRVHSTVPP